MKTAVISAALGLWLLAGQAQVLSPPVWAGTPRTHGLATGTWGGEHIVMEVTNSGARVELDCAHGEITAAIKPNVHGAFDAAGRFVAEQGGPISRDEGSRPAVAARYRGQVTGDSMTLTITLQSATADAQRAIGPFTLTRDAQPILRKCR